MDKDSKWTIKEILEWTTGYFKTKGIRSARLDAEVLLGHALNVDRLHLYLNFEKPLLPSERMRFRELVRRRALREPVSLIIGKKEFRSLSFKVKRGVLVPRPDTETLVQTVLDIISSITRPKILEIGVGSGAVSIALAHERPDAIIYANDVNPLALELARENALNAGVSTSLSIFGGDMFSALKNGTKFDVICSNPPYIPDHVIETLDPEIDYEPIRALKGGPEGLDVIAEMVSQAPEFLSRPGRLAMEIGFDQVEKVSQLLRAEGLAGERVARDLSGKPRVIVGRIE
jgi:release factor glutamine methyltransferase